ncbi:MAG: hypothetical protein JW953_21425 [Anaerolineae bacterium]|nr:hypothetical protein [Anaerolineae bacterium]
MRRRLGSIIRIDKPKDDPDHGTHGWQVRLPIGVPRKYHSKLFTDNVYGSKGKALVAAEEYLEEQLRLYPERYKSAWGEPPTFMKRPPSNNKSGRTGVYRSHSYHGKTGKKQEFWAAFCPLGPYGRHWNKRFYIVTHGEEQARALATELREMWEEAAEQGEEAVRRLFDEYFDDML